MCGLAVHTIEHVAITASNAKNPISHPLNGSLGSVPVTVENKRPAAPPRQALADLAASGCNTSMVAPSIRSVKES